VSNPSLFSVLPSVAPNGTLTYTLVTGVFGTTTFDVQVQDNGGKQVVAAAVAAGGSGYKVGDLLTLQGGASLTAAQLVVTSVDTSGAVTGVTIVADGAYTVLPTNPVAVTGGTGSGATFTLTFGGIDATDAQTFTLTVNFLDPTTTTISPTTVNSLYGQSLGFTVTVTPTDPSTATPTQPVMLYDGNPTSGGTLLGTGSLVSTGSAFEATITVGGTALAIGSHSIYAVFPTGDLNFRTSTSTPASVTVKGLTVTTVTASPGTAGYGQPVVLSATVSVSPSAGAATPVGNVIFWNGAVGTGRNLGSVTLDGSGHVSLTVNNTLIPLAAGQHSINVSYAPGNTNFLASSTSAGSLTSPPAAVIVNKASTTTTVSSSANPSVTGQAVAFTATVAPVSPGAGTVTGKVTFTDTYTDAAGTHVNTLGTTNVSGGKATLLSVTSLDAATATHTITASYSGDGNFKSSQGVTTQTVNKASTTTTLTSSANPSVTGQAVTFAAVVRAVSPGAGTPGGTVSFTDAFSGNTYTGTLSGGVATVILPFARIGTHNITARFPGSQRFLASSSAVLHQQVFYPDAVTVVSSHNPSAFGQSVTLTATVSDVTPAPAGLVPTGAADFFDRTTNTDLGTFALNASGVATLPATSSLVAATHAIAVTYLGDSSFIPKGVIFSQTVNKAATVTTVTATASPSPPVYGQAVVLSATVSVTGAGAGTPDGSVTFWDGPVGTGKNLGSAPLVGGHASLTVNALAAAAHNINASYVSASGNFAASSGVTSVTVKQAQTQTTLSSLVGSATYGQAVALTAVVAPVAPGGHVPTGTVNFFYVPVGAPTVLLGSKQLDGTGKAVFNETTVPVGTDSVVAVYAGSSNYAASPQSNAVSLDITAAVSTVAVTSLANPSFLGQSVTFTAVVLPQFSGTPTGTVTFPIDSATRPAWTVSLTGGKALLTISDSTVLGAGDHAITAVYNGDMNFPSVLSTPGSMTQTVKVQTPASLVASVNPTLVDVNSPFSLTVTVLDANNQQVFNDFAAVAIVLISGPSGGTLTSGGVATTTLNGTLKNGTITFTGLTVTKASIGTTPYVVRITSGGLTTTLSFQTGRQT
jgi:hypothetical protein